MPKDMSFTVLVS